jgi:hypothetical protein
VLGQQAVQRLPVDAGRLRGLRDVTSMSPEQVSEVFLREGLEPGLADLGERQVLPRHRRGRATSPADVVGEIPEADHRSVRECTGALDHVLELPDVARPGIGLEGRERVWLDPGEQRFAVPPVAAQEVVREERHVPARSRSGGSVIVITLTR